jgi:hypothetical protein
MMNACNQIQELKVYNSIQAFVEDPRVNAITQALEDPNGTWQRILEQANSRLDNLNSSIFKKLEDEEPYLDLILHREVSHRQFPSDDQYVTISRLNAKIITGSLIGYAWGAIQPIRPRRTSDDRIDQFNQPACA